MFRRRILFIVAAIVVSAVLAVYKCAGFESIAGVDANHDGIRDDIEELIQNKYSENSWKQKTARNLAKQIQLSIVNPEQADLKEQLKASDCLDFAFGEKSYDVLKDLEASTANSIARIKALIKFSSRFNGKIIEGSGVTEQMCRELP